MIFSRKKLWPKQDDPWGTHWHLLILEKIEEKIVWMASLSWGRAQRENIRMNFCRRKWSWSATETKIWDSERILTGNNRKSNCLGVVRNFATTSLNSHRSSPIPTPFYTSYHFEICLPTSVPYMPPFLVPWWALFRLSAATCWWPSSYHRVSPAPSFSPVSIELSLRRVDRGVYIYVNFMLR